MSLLSMIRANEKTKAQHCLSEDSLVVTLVDGLSILAFDATGQAEPWATAWLSPSFRCF